MIKPRRDGWYDWPELNNGWYRPKLVGETVFEKEPKPMLYDAKGNPMTKRRPRIGFEPPVKR